MNRIQLIGNLTKDSECRETQSSNILFFDIAVNRKYKDKSGEYKTETLFIKVNYFGKTNQIEHLKPYLIKGRDVFIDGYLKQNSWTDVNGIKRNAIEVIAQAIKPMERVTRTEIQPQDNNIFTDEDVPF